MSNDLQTRAAEINDLLAEREGLREAAAKDPRQAKIRELTDAIVKAKRAGQNFDALDRQRDELHFAVRRDLIDLQGEISNKRKSLRAALDANAADEFAKLSDDVLAEKLADNMGARRALKREASALRHVMNDREFKKTAKDLITGMPDEARAAMLAELNDKA